eukprot:Colp12_sorted_trinity150504_noHs@2749
MTSFLAKTAIKDGLNDALKSMGINRDDGEEEKDKELTEQEKEQLRKDQEAEAEKERQQRLISKKKELDKKEERNAALRSKYGIQKKETHESEVSKKVHEVAPSTTKSKKELDDQMAKEIDQAEGKKDCCIM